MPEPGAPDTSAAFFERMYAARPDPWGFGQRQSERARHEAIVAALAPRRFEAAFEAGCGEGHLTRLLADRCDGIDACDIAPSAVARARQRLREFSGVNVTCSTLTELGPLAPYDLFVLAECGYYFTAGTLLALVGTFLDNMRPGGLLVASHWTGISADHRLQGQEVQDLVARACSGRAGLLVREPHDSFLLDVWRLEPGAR